MADIKVSELTGRPLDWATGHALGAEIKDHTFGIEGCPKFSNCTVFPDGKAFTKWSPSTDWSQGGPLIERYGVWLWGPTDDRPYWLASTQKGRIDVMAFTPLIAACRAMVATEMGAVVQVPDQLVRQGSGKA